MGINLGEARGALFSALRDLDVVRANALLDGIENLAAAMALDILRRFIEGIAKAPLHHPSIDVLNHVEKTRESPK